MNQFFVIARQFSRLLFWAGLIVLVTAPGTGMAQSSRAVQSTQQLYAEPNFSAGSLGSVPQGSEVQILQQSGDWFQVQYQGQQGWLPQTAFPAGKKFEMSNLLKGKAVQESKTDEVALAGKGFTPAIEADYRKNHPNLNFAQVDQVEKFEVSPAQLQTFQREGGLR